MTNARVTMQDIADACGLSRNTVSKVFNNRGAVSPAARDLILRKAHELGYGLPAAETKHLKVGSNRNSIALFTSHIPEEYHFAAFFFTAFTDPVCRAGYNLKMFEISAEELQNKKLPPHFALEQTAGLIGIELFDQDYLDMMCGLGLPTLFIDSPTHASTRLMACDFVSMENDAGMSVVIETLIANGAKDIGFVGDYEHCGSFHERWSSYIQSLSRAGLVSDPRLCITDPDSTCYGDTDWLLSQLQRMPRIPDAFVCCNDYLALHLTTALTRLGLNIPRDVMLTGFDDIPQSSMMNPPLTTVHIPGADIGRIAASVLLRRIEHPELPYTWTRVKTMPVLRDSTNR